MNGSAMRNRAADERLTKSVHAALRSRIGKKGEAVEVSADEGTVTLRGVLSSFYEKQLSLHAAKRVAGVHGLRDELTVLSYPEE